MSISENDLPKRLAALMQTALFTGNGYATGDELFETILKSGLAAADSAAAFLFLVKEDTRECQLYAFVYQDVFYRLKEPMPVSGTAAKVFHCKKALQSIHAFEKEIFPSGMQELIYPAAAVIAAPFCVGDTCFGVIEAAGKQNGGDFTDDDLRLLNFTAGYAALVYRAFCAYNNCEKMYSIIDTVVESEHPLIAESPAMREKLEICKHLASSSVPVLLLGEKGTGKQCIAKQLHEYSNRASQPFIRVNCAGPLPLLERRLFDHPFIGSNGKADSIGNAFNGTLFLDEVAAIPLSIQKRLLDMLLQFEKRNDSVRLIASTAQNIEQLTHKGGFLSELYSKLNVLPLYLPPLRQRKEDIAPLAHFFLQKYAFELKKNFTGFSKDAEAALLNAAWEGNVRQLKNSVEYACLHGSPPFITAADLFGRQTVAVFDSDVPDNLKSAVDSFKRAYIRSILERHQWNQTAAASILGIQRTYLSRLMKELKIRQNR